MNANVVEMDNTLPLDNTSGGFRRSNEDFALKLPLSSFTGNLFGLHAEHCCHSFIPTYSEMGITTIPEPGAGLDIKQSMADVLDVSSYPAYKSQYGALSPFDVIYAPYNNYEHITVNDENIGWIMDEISPHDLFLQNKIKALLATNLR